MSTRRIEGALWTVTAALALVAALGWRATPDTEEGEPRAIPLAAAEPVLFDGESLEESATYVVEHDPFRLERRPSDLPYVPGEAGARPPPPEPPSPTLVLTGIMGGPPWQAIVRGLPGRSGETVVRQGERIGDLFVRRMVRDTVVIDGSGTSWTLTVKDAWR